MSLKNIIANKKKVEKETSSNYIIDIFIVLILCVFPLFFTDKYFNILISKYYFYLAAIAFLVIALIGIYYYEKVKRHINAFFWSELFNNFSITDWSLIVFIIVAIISTCISDFVSESFWGNEGRYTGLFLLSLYALAYFAVTRFGKVRKWHLDSFLFIALFICLFGISDYFDMDILRFKEDIVPEQHYMFTSTIGNINTYTALIGMITAIAAVLYTQENKLKKQLFYYICFIISLFAIIMGISDNALLSLGALFAFLPLYLFTKENGLKKYLIILATFFSVLKSIAWIDYVMADQVFGIDSAFNIIMNFKGLIYIVIGLWLIILFWYLMEYNLKKTLDIKGDYLRNIWLICLTLTMGIVLFLLYDVNINGNIGKYGLLNNYLLFDDDWGTYRGYIWRNALECFRDFSPIKKMFGFGPETFGIVMLNKTRGNIYGEFYDTAHNEYLQYLITVGLLGLIAYIVYIVSFIIDGIKKSAKSSYVAACLFAVICYASQAFVNLGLPIVTPIMLLLLALGKLGCKQIEN